MFKKLSNGKKGNMKANGKPKKKALYVPSAFLIILGLMLFLILISWICKVADVHTKVWVPAVKPITPGGTLVKGHFESRPIIGLGIIDIFVAVWQGFVSKAAVILFIFSIGGMLGIMAKTKTMDAGISRVVAKLDGKEIFMIPILMVLFGLGGTTFGMWEETIAFFPVLIPVFIKAKYNPITAVMVILVGAGAGDLASTVNPFAITIAFSGANDVIPNAVSQSTMLGSRWIAFILFEGLAIAFVMWTAVKMKNTNNGEVQGIDSKAISAKFQSVDGIKFNWKRKLTLTVFSLGFVILIVSFLPWKSFISEAGLNSFNNFMHKYFFWLASSNGGWALWGDWYFISVSGVFLIIAIITFCINNNDFVEKDKNKEQVFINTYVDGVKDILSVCLLIATAGGLGFLLTTSNIGPLIANSASGIGKAGLIGFGILMFIMAFLLSFILPSTSGFAAAFMPIFGSIAVTAFPDQAATAVALTVMAFIFGSGIANLVTPTSAALMAYTSFSGISYFVWIKKIWPLTVAFLGLGIVFITFVATLGMYGIVF